LKKILLALLGLLTLTAATSEYPYPPLQCSNPCVISGSPGGIIDTFAAEGRQLLADKTPVIVDGPCLSACTVLVDEARANVCITRQAVLGYHKASDGTDIEYKTPGLNEYIKLHGGLPDPDSGHLLLLNFNEAKAFYTPCIGN
jgi:hypothetical protein